MLTSMGDVMREAYKRGWITTRDGNISLRRRDSFYITPSGGRKAIIHPEHILKAKLSNTNELYFGLATDSKPSGELEMHRLLQTVDFRGCRAVVHLHPTYCIAAMHAGFNLKDLASQFPEVSRYTRVGNNVRVLPVTSDILAKETYEAMTSEFTEGHQVDPYLIADVVGQEAHGVCAIGKSPWDAFEHIERLEHICQIVLASGVKP
jgi:ribulose-5-phosphate 4-epimerase/fuculose-1-phosphate aldolase